MPVPPDTDTNFIFNIINNANLDKLKDGILTTTRKNALITLIIPSIGEDLLKILEPSTLPEKEAAASKYIKEKISENFRKNHKNAFRGTDYASANVDKKDVEDFAKDINSFYLKDEDLELLKLFEEDDLFKKGIKGGNINSFYNKDNLENFEKKYGEEACKKLLELANAMLKLDKVLFLILNVAKFDKKFDLTSSKNLCEIEPLVHTNKYNFKYNRAAVGSPTIIETYGNFFNMTFDITKFSEELIIPKKSSYFASVLLRLKEDVLSKTKPNDTIYSEIVNEDATIQLFNESVKSSLSNEVLRDLMTRLTGKTKAMREINQEKELSNIINKQSQEIKQLIHDSKPIDMNSFKILKEEFKRIKEALFPSDDKANFFKIIHSILKEDKELKAASKVDDDFYKEDNLKLYAQKFGNIDGMVNFAALLLDVDKYLVKLITASNYLANDKDFVGLSGNTEADNLIIKNDKGVLKVIYNVTDELTDFLDLKFDVGTFNINDRFIDKFVKQLDKSEAQNNSRRFYFASVIKRIYDWGTP
jgi:hypothetical protein